MNGSDIFCLCGICWLGIGDLFVTIAARKLNAYTATFWSLPITIVLLSIFAPFMLNDLKHLSLNIFLLNFFLGLILLIGIITFREALIKGSSPVVMIIATSYSALTTILSIIFFQEKLNFYQDLSILVVFLGLLLVLFDLKQLIKGKIHLDKAAILALISALTWGIYFTFIILPVKEIGWFWPNYFSFIFFLPLLLFFIKLRKIKLYKPTHNGGFSSLVLGTILARGAEISFNLGISKGYTSIVAPIAGANPILFVILAAIFLKDKMTKQQITGVIATLVGIILLSIFSI